MEIELPITILNAETIIKYLQIAKGDNKKDVSFVFSSPSGTKISFKVEVDYEN